MFNTLLRYLLLAGCVVSCLLLGRWVSQYAPILPAALWGMLCFAGLLVAMKASGLSPEAYLQAPVQHLVKYLSFVFLPVCVGILQYEALIASSGGKILLVGLCATFTGMTVVAWLSKQFLSSAEDD